MAILTSEGSLGFISFSYLDEVVAGLEVGLHEDGSILKAGKGFYNKDKKIGKVRSEREFCYALKVYFPPGKDLLI